MNSETIPSCVGFIMDGNRRWALQHGVATAKGHEKGYEALKQTIDAVYDAGIPHMVCYAFSSENWKRSEQEVSHLMSLMEYAFDDLIRTFKKSEQKIAVRFIGERERFSEHFQQKMVDVEKIHREDALLTVWIALSYGARTEIVQAVNTAVLQGERVDEQSFARMLMTAGMPDPDLIIRTSGEKRLSNFLLFQSAYSELFFTDTLWPDFGEVEFKGILDAYGKRERRKGA